MVTLLPRYALIAGLAVILSGCGGPSYPPSALLALDGPPLALVVQSDSASWKGAMDRGCMAGFGHFTVRKTDGSAVCSGDVDHPATDKGRMYADLLCDDGAFLTVIYRNLGPDQGMGLVRIIEQGMEGAEGANSGERAVLFYHPSTEEAERRLVQVRKDIAKAMERQRKRDEPLE